jgi:thiamine-phosphate pyrophosphorylase
VDERRARLARARLYVCVGVRPDLAEICEEILSAGVDILQLRHKGLEAAAELQHLAVVKELCERHGALFAVNDRADLAVVAGADIIHVGQGDLTPTQARQLVGPDVIVGRSTHDVEQASGAMADPDVDYFCAGPVWETATKPGRPAAGMDVVRHSTTATKPWFAIGGIDAGTVRQVHRAGATRVVVVRAVLDVADPAGAVQHLLRALG